MLRLRKLALVVSCTLGLLIPLGAALPAAFAAEASAATPATASAATPDPTVPGPYASTRVLYDAGLTEVGGGTTIQEIEQELNGDIFIPQGTTGPMPVIVFEHGRHASCTYDGSLVPEETLGDPCPALAVGGVQITEPVNSYAGYDYLGAQLASHGYLVMSVSANGVNTYDDASATTVGGDEGAEARAQIFSKSLDLLSKWNAGPDTDATGVGSALIGRVDLSRIGVMGHSRGGEGSNAFVTYNQTRPATAAAAAAARTLDYGPRYPGLKAAFALAPIDAAAQAPQGVAMASLVPYCDGDVYDLEGTRAFEREAVANSAAGFPSVLYGVNGADHNFYNTVWTADGDDNATTADTACDGTGDANTASGVRLTPAEEQATGSVLIAGFLRRFVGPEPAFAPLVTGAAHLPASACPSAHAVSCDREVQTSYIAPAAERHVVYGPRATGDVPVTASGFTTDSTCTPTSSGTGCPATASGTDTAFTDYSTTAQRHLVFDRPATLTADLSGAPDASAYTVLTLRMAASYADTARNPQGVTQDLTLTLRDMAGHSATVPASAYAAGALYPEPHGTGGHPEVVLGDVRVPLAAFSGVDLTQLSSLTLGFGTLMRTGNVQLADIAFQEAAAPAAPAALPEAPGAALLPLAGLMVVATVVWRRRRRAAVTA